MPNILAIDTSTDACSVAVLTPSGIDQTLTISPREHTQRLLPTVEALLSAHQLALSQFDAIAFTVGPGSFTGLRIGISVAQGLAYGADLPLISVSTLQAMAQTAIRLSPVSSQQIIVPVIDARMDEVYWSAYRLEEGETIVKEVCPETMSHPSEAAVDDQITADTLIGVGSGWAYESLQHRYNTSTTVEFYPHAYDVALLAEEAFHRQAFTSPLEAVPTYIRDEVSWKKRQRIRQPSA